MKTNIEVGTHKIRVLDGHYTGENGATPAAHDFAKQLIDLLPQMKKFATQQLLETYNDVWAEDEDEELTASEFEVNLTNPEIVIYDELGAATVYFADSDMFGGHLIDVSVNEGKISDASLVG